MLKTTKKLYQSHQQGFHIPASATFSKWIFTAYPH